MIVPVNYSYNPGSPFNANNALVRGLQGLGGNWMLLGAILLGMTYLGSSKMNPFK